MSFFTEGRQGRKGCEANVHESVLSPLVLLATFAIFRSRTFGNFSWLKCCQFSSTFSPPLRFLRCLLFHSIFSSPNRSPRFDDTPRFPAKYVTYEQYTTEWLNFVHFVKIFPKFFSPPYEQEKTEAIDRKQGATPAMASRCKRRSTPCIAASKRCRRK